MTALFVPQQFYFRFAAAMAREGYDVYTFDDRGSGESLAAEGRPWKHRLVDWAELDLPAVIGACHERRPGHRLFVVGHSMGGQLVGLTRHVHGLDGVVTVSATAAYWGHWTRTTRYGLLAWYATIPLWTRAFRSIPASRLGLGADTEAQLMRDWAAWGRHPDYFLGAPFDGRSEMARYRGRVLAFSFTDDRHVSCRAPVDALHRHYEKAEVTRRHLHPEEVGAARVGHFGYFRAEAGPRLWQQTIEWMEANGSAPAEA
jgi:predicted alpha/beta hydrolase